MKIPMRKAAFSVLLALSVTGASEAFGQTVNVIYQGRELKGPGVEASYLDFRTDNFDLEPQFMGGKVIFQSNDASKRQQLSGVFKAADGSLLIVDGGVPENADKLSGTIKELGGTVDAWIITHPQDDHVGALYEILHNNTAGIKIKNIDSNFHNFMWYAETAPEEQGMVWNLMTELEEEKNSAEGPSLHSDIKRGDVITVSENISVKVLNDPMKIENSSYAINDSGIMYDILFEGKHFFIAGDMGPDGGDILLEQGVLAGVEADYCVMAHHGQNGVKEDFYRELSPKACIWSCPPWLFDAQFGNTGGLKTYETKQWIKKMNISKNYCTYDKDINLR